MNKRFENLVLNSPANNTLGKMKNYYKDCPRIVKILEGAIGEKGEDRRAIIIHLKHAIFITLVKDFEKFKPYKIFPYYGGWWALAVEEI